MIPSDTLTVTRYAAGSRDSNGRWVDGSTSTFPILAAVQRPSPRTLARLQEGGHSRDAWNVDTTTELRTLNELSGVQADQIAIDGELYEVFEVEQLRAVLPHYECLVLRVRQSP